MNSTNSRLSTRRAASLATLLGSASVLSMAGVSAASAAVPVAEVLITGSLIAGAPAVGVPVTALGQEDFTEVGALNVLELLESVPSLYVPPTNSAAYGAGTLHFANNVQIHGLGVGDTLMMVDGVRWPLMGYDGERVDPAIIPQLAVERVDVLTAGASATYGADATSGVINIILKRNYEGAETFIRGGFAPGAGNESVTLAQLWGTSWDTGNVTLTYEFQRVNRVLGKDLPWYTWNFGESGFEGFDFTQIAASPQGFVTTRGPLNQARINAGGDVPDDYRLGSAVRAAGVQTPVGRGELGCFNCWNVPHGIGWEFGTQDPGPTTSWAALQAGGQGVNPANLRNPWHDGWVRPEMESTAAVMTFNQRLTPMLELFGVNLGSVTLNVDAMWSNRRFKQAYSGDQGQTREHMTRIGRGIEVPRSNPYFPSGVPESERLFAHFSLGQESEDIVSGGMQNGRWLTSLDFDELPFNWRGNVSYAQTDNFSYGFDRGGVNRTNYAAAIGLPQDIDGTDLGASSGEITLVKPAGVPFLNPFCDSLVIQQCNSQTTLDWITGHRDQQLRSHFTELSAQIDGPLFDLPAGPILVAFAVNRSNRSQAFRQEDNTNSEYLGQIVVTGDNIYETNDAVIGQANIPLVGGDFSAPGFESLELELGLRYDEYNTFSGGVWTPKYALNWGVGYGLTFRASYGESFRTPKGEEISSTGAGVQARNISGSIESVNSTLVDCETRLPSGGTAGVAAPGSLAAIINPTCNTMDSRLFAPTIVDVTGPPVLAGPIISASGLGPAGLNLDLGPQEAKQWNLGLNWTPNNDFLDGALVGLSVDATWWQLDYFDLIDSIFRGRGPNDPLSGGFYIPISNPNAPITDPSNATFLQLVKDLANVPTRVARAPDDFGIETTRAIGINFNGNLGRSLYSGIDFSVRYDWEMGNLGSFHVGADGSYELSQKNKGAEGDAWEDKYRFDQGGELASGNRLNRVRYRTGWTDGTWTVNVFGNYYGHGVSGSEGDGGIDSNAQILTPRCFYTAGESCYPGAPNYSASIDPDTGDFPFLSPANLLVDLQIGFNTGMSFDNEYLHNIGISLSITNLLDKTPPQGVYPLRSRGTGIAAFDRTYPDLAREVSVTINKVW